VDHRISKSFLLARRPLIEGPGEISSAAWAITAFRVAKGWGILPEAYWPDQGIVRGNVMPNEPANADAIAKASRISHYQRLRNEHECLYALINDQMPAATLEISKAWNKENAKGGRIQLISEYPVTAVHCINLGAFDFESQEFVFPNTWGTEWGDRGLGYLPFGYLSQFMVEAWTAPSFFGIPFQPTRPGLDIRLREAEKSKLGIIYVIEIVDGDKDIMAGWACVIQKPRKSIDVEELFIRPEYRRQGLGAELVRWILDLREKISVPIRFWIPWGDHTDHNATALVQWAKKAGLKLEPSGVRWAAYRAEVGSPVISLPALHWIPAKPASPHHLLEDVPIITHPGDNAIWNDELAARRAELVEKKYRSSLSDAELAELDALQEAFGRYQDSIAPFSP
jgi:GNAT superfamily N-acetyltransferase